MAHSMSLLTLNSCGLSPCCAPTLSVFCDVGYRSYAVSTATSIGLSEIGAGLFLDHFIFEVLLLLFGPVLNDLQKPPTIMSVGEVRDRRM